MSRSLGCAKCKGIGAGDSCLGCNIQFHKECMKKIEMFDANVTSYSYQEDRCEKCAEYYQQKFALVHKIKKEVHDTTTRLLEKIATKAEFMMNIEVPVSHTESILKFKEVLLKIEDLLEG